MQFGKISQRLNQVKIRIEPKDHGGESFNCCIGWIDRLYFFFCSGKEKQTFQYLNHSMCVFLGFGILVTWTSPNQNLGVCISCFFRHFASTGKAGLNVYNYSNVLSCMMIYYHVYYMKSYNVCTCIVYTILYMFWIDI